MIHFSEFLLLAVIPCYLYVFKKDRYLEYFKEYESWSKPEKMKYGWASFGYIISVFVLFLWSITL